MADRSASARTDQDQEFELVLGNKQIFSVLFVVFVLLGVFFAMGYGMGRRTAPEVATAVAPDPGAGDEDSKPSATGGTLPLVTERDEDSRLSPVARPRGPDPVPDSAAGVSGRIIDPRPGQAFLQVSAVARPEAELLVDVLLRKSFPAVIAPGPNERLFRVLVGPARSDAELARVKGDLEKSGFKPMVRRY